MNQSNNLIQALQEFHQKQSELTTGYLVLINDQVHHFLTKKDGESQKETLLTPNRHCFRLVNLEAGHKGKNY